MKIKLIDYVMRDIENGVYKYLIGLSKDEVINTICPHEMEFRGNHHEEYSYCTRYDSCENCWNREIEVDE